MGSFQETLIDPICFPMVWPTVHAYPVEMVTKNASFQKRSAPMEIFENAVLLYSSGWIKREVFEDFDSSKCTCSHQRWYRC